MFRRNKLKVLVAFVIVIYILSPIIFKYTPFIQRSLLFMNHVNTQYGFNLSQPENLGIKCSRLLELNHFVDLGDKPTNTDHNNIKLSIELGGWHILPESSLPHCVTNHEVNRTYIEDKLAFADSRPIVLYIHGNGGNRAGNHRGDLYRRLAYQHNYHVVTFDYRGYGDSTNLQPTANGLSSDANFVYRWLISQENVTKDRVVIWGHSLGTAVATRMVAELPSDAKPGRLILEAPFDTMANAIANHPFSAPFRIIPYFEHFFVEPVKNSPELNFDSVEKITKIKQTPIMILHAEDDAIIPLKLGQNLYRKAVQALGESKVKFITISASHNLGHKHICRHDSTMARVKQFIEGKL